MSETPEKLELPPKYYLEYFNYVLAFVQEKYQHLLQENEWHFLRKYYCLTEDAQCLFIRFSNRRGLFFKVNKLAYKEIEDIPASLTELIEREFIEPISADKHLDFGKDLLGVFSKTELSSLFFKTKLSKKEDFIEEILQTLPFEEIVQKINQREPIIKVCFEKEVAFLKFLFFGNRYLDMTEFVVRDLGFVQYQHYDDDKLVARFNTRKDAEDKWMITDQHEVFNQLKELGQPIEIYDWFLNFSDSLTDDLSEIAKPSYERLVLKIGTFLEKNKLYDEAIEVLKLTPQVPSRERQVRCLEKLKHVEEAISLCHEMIELPRNADEKFFALDFLNRIQSKKRTTKKNTTIWLHNSEAIRLSDVFRHQVELGVIDYYMAENKEAVFSENHLWRAIFGLIFWDIIFDPSLVAFHHPFQRRPSDLYLPDFYEKRKELIINHLDSFHNINELLIFMGEKFVEKVDIANPFVIWLEEIWTMARKAVEVIEFEALKKILHEMSKNLVENLRGFPDLFVWDDADYCFVEVKSETDSLSNQQLFWLQFFEEIGVKSKVLRVFWDKTENEIKAPTLTN